MHKMRSEMRNMFKEKRLMSQADVVEQYQVLVQLSHISHMRHHGNAILPTQQAYRDELTHAAQPYRIRLYKTRRTGLQVIFK